MKKIINFYPMLGFILIPLALVGCASTPYVPPATGPKAELTLRYAPTRGGHAAVNAWSNDKCEGRMYITDFNQGDTFTTTVEADKRFHFSYVWVTTSSPGYAYSICRVHGSFVPKAGKSYRAELLIKDDACYVPVFSVDGSSQLKEPTSVAEKACTNY